MERWLLSKETRVLAQDFRVASRHLEPPSPQDKRVGQKDRQGTADCESQGICDRTRVKMEQPVASRGRKHVTPAEALYFTSPPLWI